MYMYAFVLDFGQCIKTVHCEDGGTKKKGRHQHESVFNTEYQIFQWLLFDLTIQRKAEIRNFFHLFFHFFGSFVYSVTDFFTISYFPKENLFLLFVSNFSFSGHFLFCVRSLSLPFVSFLCFFDSLLSSGIYMEPVQVLTQIFNDFFLYCFRMHFAQCTQSCATESFKIQSKRYRGNSILKSVHELRFFCSSHR